MGLNILEFKKLGQTYANAYAKVSSVRYDNNSKVATFNISVYSNKTDKNLITEIRDLFVRVSPNKDIVMQCYEQAAGLITQNKVQIARLKASNDAIVNDDARKLRNVQNISRMEGYDLLQLDGAVSDEVSA